MSSNAYFDVPSYQGNIPMPDFGPNGNPLKAGQWRTRMSTAAALGEASKNKKYPNQLDPMFDQEQLNILNTVRALAVFRKYNRDNDKQWKALGTSLAYKLDPYGREVLWKEAMKLGYKMFNNVQFVQADRRLDAAVHFMRYDPPSKEFMEFDVMVEKAIGRVPHSKEEWAERRQKMQKDIDLVVRAKARFAEADRKKAQEAEAEAALDSMVSNLDYDIEQQMRDEDLDKYILEYEHPGGELVREGNKFSVRDPSQYATTFNPMKRGRDPEVLLLEDAADNQETDFDLVTSGKRMRRDPDVEESQLDDYNFNLGDLYDSDQEFEDDITDFLAK